MNAQSNRSRTLAALLAPALIGLLAVSGCKKQEAAAPVVAAPLHAPKDQGDKKAWIAYYQDVVGRNSKDIEGTTSPYFLPAPNVSKYQEMYDVQLGMVSGAVGRGVLPGNMLAFMSPDSTKMADLVVEAFKKASPGSFKKVTVLFIGKAEDNDRVKAAVEPSGATYKFIEMN